MTITRFIRVWYLAARPKTLWAAVAPVLMGTALAYADGAFHGLSALAALAGALLIQVGTNFCNDYADFKKGADTEERIGPVRATQAGWVTPRQMLLATLLVFALATLAGAYLVYRGGTLMLIIAAASILAGVLYTAGPYALAYLGLGDVFVLIFFGPIAVGGTYYVQALEWPWMLTVVGLAPGLLSCAILSVNNLRDVNQDRKACKRTLAVRFGVRFARAEYIGCILLGVIVVPLIHWQGQGRDAIWPLLPILSIMVAIRPLRTVISGTAGPALNPVLGQTAKLLLGYALLFTAAMICSTL